MLFRILTFFNANRRASAQRLGLWDRLPGDGCRFRLPGARVLPFALDRVRLAGPSQGRCACVSGARDLAGPMAACGDLACVTAPGIPWRRPARTGAIPTGLVL